MNNTSEYWIKNLHLEPHVEGGYFKEIYRSAELINNDNLPGRYIGERCFSTSIYFLLNEKEKSKLHRLKSDEIWHFYTGTSLRIYIINHKGKLDIVKLGNNFDEGELLQVVIKAGNWFCAEVNDKSSFALIGCTVAPGFDFSDFELGDKTKLLQLFPQHKEIIEKFAT